MAVLRILAVAGAALATLIAARMRPPALMVATSCATLVAILLTAELIAWVARAGDRFKREERLATFALFAAIVLSWLGAEQKISEVELNYRVAEQATVLAAGARELSRDILSFIDERQRTAPLLRPASWDQDVLARRQFDTDTIATYQQRLGNRVRRTHDLLTFRNLRAGELDAYYRRPANDVQIRMVAQQLALLGEKLERQTPASR